MRDRIAGESADARKSFIESVVTTRNYLTHYDVSLEHRAATDVALYRLTLQLRAIIETCLLRELGFECDEIDEILQRVRRYEEIDLHRPTSRTLTGEANGAATTETNTEPTGEP